MSLLDKLMGRDDPAPAPNVPSPTAPAPTTPAAPTDSASNADEQAVSRYRYMLKTAPPESIEQAHREAFERLTPEQRRLALQKLSESAPPEERPQGDDPQSLARAATRAEVRQPGALSGMFGGGGGVGLGGIIGGSLLGSIAGSFIGSSIANAFFANPLHAQGYNGFAQQNGNDAKDEAKNDETPNDAAQNDGTGVNDGANAANDAPAPPDPLGDPADAGGLDAGGLDAGGLDAGGLDAGFGGDDLGGLDDLGF